MKHIVLADHALVSRMEEAATELRKRGYKVDVLGNKEEIIKIFLNSPPDVMVLSHNLLKGSGFLLVEELNKRRPDHSCQFIWVAYPDECDGEPKVSWDLQEYSNFLAFPPSSWQIVLSVEQLLFRTVSSTPMYGDT